MSIFSSLNWPIFFCSSLSDKDMWHFSIQKYTKWTIQSFFLWTNFHANKTHTYTYIHTKGGRIGNVYILIIARDHFFKMLIPLYDILKNILQIYWLHIHGCHCPKYGEVVKSFSIFHVVFHSSVYYSNVHVTAFCPNAKFCRIMHSLVSTTQILTVSLIILHKGHYINLSLINFLFI